MDLSIITVTWNSSDKISKQLKSTAKACAGLEFEQIVVDNDSSDNTVQTIKSDYKNVILLENKENKGFGAANNQGAGIAKGRYLLFLNPDMKLEEGSLKIFIDWFDRQDNKTVIAGPKLVNKQGNFNKNCSPRRFPNTGEVFFMMYKLHHIFPSVLKDYLMHDFDDTKQQIVDSIRGSFMLMKRSFYEELGWAFDPRYYIWFEDVDVCREAKSRGYNVVYTPIISATDYLATSFSKRNFFWKQKNFTLSAIRYFKKWGRVWNWLPLAVIRPQILFIAWIIGMFNKDKI